MAPGITGTDQLQRFGSGEGSDKPRISIEQLKDLVEYLIYIDL